MSIFPLNNCDTIEGESLRDRSLTGRELEILEMVSLGMSTDEIALNLYLSQDTIKSHRKSLLVKFRARNMAQMIMLAFEQGVFVENNSMSSEKQITCNTLFKNHNSPRSLPWLDETDRLE